MVFFRKQLRRSMQLHPKYLGQNLRQTIKAQLTRDVEGTENGGAKIVLVQDMNDDDISKGLVDAQSGFVTFDVKFYAILFKAFTNEVLLATVKQVSEQMAEGSSYQADSNTWHNAETEEIIESGSQIRVRVCSATAGRAGVLGSTGGDFLGLASSQS